MPEAKERATRCPPPTFLSPFIGQMKKFRAAKLSGNPSNAYVREAFARALNCKASYNELFKQSLVLYCQTHFCCCANFKNFKHIYYLKLLHFISNLLSFQLLFIKKALLELKLFKERNFTLILLCYGAKQLISG